VGGLRHGGTAGGVAVPMEARGGNRRTGPKGLAERPDFGGSEGDKNGLSDEMGQKPKRLQHKLFLFFIQF
jgi:hypothetical protein